MRILKLAATVLALAFSAGAAQARDPLILISIDGFRADYLARGNTPVLAKLAATGVHAERMLPVFPSVTAPNHQSIVTGLYPDHHGIVANEFEDPVLGVYKDSRDDPRWYAQGEPIWMTAEKAGLRTESTGWPGANGKSPGFNPDHWVTNPWEMSDDARVDQALGWLSGSPDKLPAMVLLYFGEVDEAGHKHGPGSAEVNAAMAAIDTAIGKLVAGLEQKGLKANLVIVSDHGMIPTPRENLLVIDQSFDLKGGHLVSVGAVGFVALPKGPQGAVVQKTLTAPHDNMACWARSDIPARYKFGKNPRVADVVCEMKPGWNVTDTAKLPLWRKMMAADHPYGNHGYDPALPMMGALFIANGPAFKKGMTIKPFTNVDVYPLMAKVLGVTPRANDGQMAHLQPILAN